LEENVVGEIEFHPKTKRPGRECLEEMQRLGQIKIVQCTPEQQKEFIRLVGAPNPEDDLDDGEAATLACAQNEGCAALDERKGRRIAKRDYPKLKTYCTLDLLFSPACIRFFGFERMAQAARDAKSLARMRILAEWRDYMSPIITELNPEGPSLRTAITG
jgi:hypothetical protein